MPRTISPALAVVAGCLTFLALGGSADAAPIPQSGLDLAPEAPFLSACHRGYHHFSGRPCGYGYGYGYRHRRYGPPAYYAPPAYGRQVCRWRHDEWGRPVRVCRWR